MRTGHGCSLWVRAISHRPNAHEQPHTGAASRRRRNRAPISWPVAHARRADRSTRALVRRAVDRRRSDQRGLVAEARPTRFMSAAKRGSARIGSKKLSASDSLEKNESRSVAARSSNVSAFSRSPKPNIDPRRGRRGARRLSDLALEVLGDVGGLASLAGSRIRVTQQARTPASNQRRGAWPSRAERSRPERDSPGARRRQA